FFSTAPTRTPRRFSASSVRTTVFRSSSFTGRATVAAGAGLSAFAGDGFWVASHHAPAATAADTARTKTADVSCCRNLMARSFARVAAREVFRGGAGIVGATGIILPGLGKDRPVQLATPCPGGRRPRPLLRAW